jgi:hypothetical protein
VKLGVATWNMDHWKRMRDDPSGQTQRDAWAYLQTLNVDVALVQEAVPPPFIDPATWPVRSHPAPDQPDAWFIHPRYRRWGSAVVVFNPALEFEPIETTPLNSPRDHKGLWISHPGTWAGVRIAPPDQPPINLISAYGLFDDWNAEIKSGYTTTTVNRLMSDLTPLLDSEEGARTLIAGDLNVGTQYTDPSPEEPHRWGRMHRATMERISAFGLVDSLAKCVAPDRGPLVGCPCGPAPDCRHVRTYRHDNRTDGPPWQNESFFATRALADGLATCAAVDDEAAWALSDHCPVIAEFDL